MSRGPLPDPKRRRRNAPTIPTTDLPASGRAGDPPDVPEAYSLGEPGEAWWNWAWHLPQACAWDEGTLYLAARRASLEDELAALETAEDEFAVEALLSEMVGADHDYNEITKVGRGIDRLIGRLKRNATGSMSVMKEMRELDNKLGLSPESLAKLRWRIVDDSKEKVEPSGSPEPSKKTADRKARLSVVKAA